MAADKLLKMVREDLKACAAQLLRAAENCETADELNASLQACRQQLQSDAHFIGKAIQQQQEGQG